MDLQGYHVSLLHTPFEACGIQLHRCATSTNPLVHLRASHLEPIGVRGVRVLSVKHKNNLEEESFALTALKPVDASHIPLRFVTMHKRGQLLVWDGSSSELVGSCSHGRKTTVNQCLMSDDYIFTTVELYPSVTRHDVEVLYQWDANTLESVNNFSFTQRIDVMALKPDSQSVLITASEALVELWDYSRSASTGSLELLQTINCKAVGIPTQMIVMNDLIFLSGTSLELSVLSCTTGALLARTHDQQRSARCLRVFQASSTAKCAAITGSIDGSVAYWSFNLQSTSGVLTLSTNERRRPLTTAITDVVMDGNVMVCASEYSGAAVTHRVDGTVKMLCDAPCRSIVLDKNNNLLIIGNDKGVVSVFNYAAFSASSKNKMECIFTCTPHPSAVTGISLQLEEGSMWHQLLSCSMDGTISTIHFRKTAPVLSLPCAYHEQFSMLISSGPATAWLDINGRKVHFFTNHFDNHSQYPFLSLKEDNMVSVAWVGSDLAVAFKTGVKVFSVTHGKWNDGAQWAVSDWDAQVYGIDVASDGTILAFGEHSNNGAFSILRYENGTLKELCRQDVRKLCPRRGKLHCCAYGDDAWGTDYFILLGGKDVLRTNHLTVVDGEWVCTDHGKIIMDSAQNQRIFVNSTNDSMEIPYVQSGIAYCASFDVATHCEDELKASRIPAAESHSITKIEKRVKAICLGDATTIQAILLREKSDSADVILCDGHVGYHLTYSGDVTPTDNFTRHKALSFPTAEGSPIGPVSCASVIYHCEGRYAALAYTNGLLQIFDVNEERVISRWFTPHRGNVQLVGLTDGVMLLSEGYSSMSCYLIPRRFVYDSDNRF